MNFIKQLTEFTRSKKDFSVVYSPLRDFQLVTPKTSRVFILDSSFNPPHLGHLSLVKEAVDFEYHNGVVPKDQCTILLLLSVKNADKPTDISQLHHRLSMMHLMAKSLERDMKLHVSIGLTKHAKFLDKSVSLSNYLSDIGKDDNLSNIGNGEILQKHMKLTFLVGFDTLERIFDEKYYLPDKLLDSLGSFMDSSDLFCLTRATDYSVCNEQLEYVQKIRHGGFAHIPQIWGKGIHLKSIPDSSVGLVSSTKIRRAFAAGLTPDQVPVLPEISSYIQENRLYQPENLSSDQINLLDN